MIRPMIKCWLAAAVLICSLFISCTASAAITFSAATTAQSNGGSVIFSHTVGAGSNKILIVGVSIDQTTTATVVNTVTYGGTAMTRVGDTTGVVNTMRISLWQLVNPPSGSANVIVTPSTNNTAFIVGAVSYFGVNQTTPLGTFVQATGGSGSPTVNATSATNDLVVDVVSVGGALLGNSLTGGAGQSERYNVNTAVLLGGGMIGASSTKPGAATVTMSWKQNGFLFNGPWAIGWR